MEYVFTGIAVFLGVVIADLVVAAIAMLRARKAYDERIEHLQRMLVREEPESDDAGRLGGGYA